MKGAFDPPVHFFTSMFPFNLVVDQTNNSKQIPTQIITKYLQKNMQKSPKKH